MSQSISFFAVAAAIDFADWAALCMYLDSKLFQILEQFHILFYSFLSKGRSQVWREWTPC